jgi:hypothetical protein
VRPLLGNPFVVGANDVATFIAEGDSDDFVAAIQVDDTEALDRMIDKTKPDEQGEVAGATVYEDDGSRFAVEDDMLVFAGTEEALESALERADGDDSLSTDTFERSLEGLPERALARIYFNLQVLIARDPDTQEARRVDWVSALRTFGMTASAQGDDRLDVEFNMRADGQGLTDEDLPLAAGDESPRVVQVPGEVGLALRDPSQVIDFFEATFQTLDPDAFGDYEAGKRAIAQRFAIDVDEDVVGQLTGDLSISVALDGAFSARADVADPDAFAGTVDRLAETLPQLGAGQGVTDVRRRGELYEARLANGDRFVFGMSGDVFVATSNAARAQRFASQEPEEVPDASGSVAMTADAERLALQVLRQIGPQLGFDALLGGNLFAGPLDELTGSMVTETGGMRGSFSLTLD